MYYIISIELIPSILVLFLRIYLKKKYLDLIKVSGFDTWWSYYNPFSRYNNKPNS